MYLYIWTLMVIISSTLIIHDAAQIIPRAFPLADHIHRENQRAFGTQDTQHNDFVQHSWSGTNNRVSGNVLNDRVHIHHSHGSARFHSEPNFPVDVSSLHNVQPATRRLTRPGFHPNLAIPAVNQAGSPQSMGMSRVFSGRPTPWNANPLLGNNVDFRRNGEFRRRLVANGLSPSGIVHRRNQPNYQIAGGAGCQAQCMNGAASRSCFCARYMCYYQGCSSNCQLISHGTTIRALCKHINSDPYYVAPTNPNIPKCQQSLDPGTCTSNLYTRYGYDSYSKKCVSFSYSGCGGNENRFTTRNACLSTCVH